MPGRCEASLIPPPSSTFLFIEEPKAVGLPSEIPPLACGRDGGDLRNNFDRAWRAGRTSRELMDLFGWSNLKVAARYAKADQERIRETLRRVPMPAADCTNQRQYRLA